MTTIEIRKGRRTGPSQASQASQAPPILLPPSPTSLAFSADIYEELLLKQRLQKLETQVVANWTQFVTSEIKDPDFVQQFIVPRNLRDSSNSTNSTGQELPLQVAEAEAELREIPPSTEFASQVRHWVEQQLQNKSQLAETLSGLRIELERRYRSLIRPLEVEILDKLKRVFLKFSGAASSTSPLLSRRPDQTTLAQDIQVWLQQNYPVALVGHSSVSFSTMPPKALLTFLLGLKEELSVMAAPPGPSPLPPPGPSPLSLPPQLPPMPPSQYIDQLARRDQEMIRLAQDHQRQVNALKDKRMTEHIRTTAQRRSWALEAPLPKWIEQCRVMDIDTSHEAMADWQNTTLKQRQISSEVRQILMDGDARLQVIGHRLVLLTQQQIQHAKDQYAIAEEKHGKQMQKALAAAGNGNGNEKEKALADLQRWIHLRERLWNLRQGVRITQLWRF